MIPEFSRPLSVERIGAAGRSSELSADENECRALAERFGILAVETLSARLTLRAHGPLVHIEGRLAARVVQACVVTLDPVAAEIDEAFAITFGPELPEDSDELVIDLDTEDPPEPIIDGKIDLGEVVAEHLALALDPFPRSPGAVFAAPEDADTAGAFAALAALRKKSPG
ncbi:MAG TPA: DUF177 domain-containing protein [Rhodospirillaceae bacterium]|nr:DUF177 domain-containing protein [Rhodospirillaceae bacterium]